MKNKEWVQCFFNVTFNYANSDGQSKFFYGFAWFHLCGDCRPLTEQVVDEITKSGEIKRDDMFNVQVNALTPFHSHVFAHNPNLKGEELDDENI